MPTDSVRIEALLDKQDIYEALLRYCRGADRADEALVASVFSDDSYVDYVTFFKGTGVELAKVIGRSEPRPVTSHFIGNVWVDLDGDTAHSESYYLGFVYYTGAHGSGASIDVDVRSYRFLDRWRREPAGWKVVRRNVIKDFSWVAEGVTPADPLTAAFGLRSADDPQYSFEEVSQIDPPSEQQGLLGIGPTSMLLRTSLAAVEQMVSSGQLESVEVPELGVTMIPSAQVFRMCDPGGNAPTAVGH